jgi:hypothetical protein
MIEDINDLRADGNYLLVYVRHKTDEEIKQDKEVSRPEDSIKFLMKFKSQFLKYNAVL